MALFVRGTGSAVAVLLQSRRFPVLDLRLTFRYTRAAMEPLSDRRSPGSVSAMTAGSNPLDSFHVVLVESGESLNVGAVARAMMNLGFRHLHLVAPRRYDPGRAEVTARSAKPLLESLVIHQRFEAAVSEMEEVVGFALRKGESRSHFVTLPQWALDLPARPLRTTALLFGPEDDDLRQEHLEKCRWVVRIPSAQPFPSFNLAQSVLLALYEIAGVLPGAPAAAPLLPAEEVPTGNEYYHLDRLLDAVMAESGFVRPGTPEPVPGVVRNLFRRLPMSRHEMRILLALFGRLRSTLLRRREHGE